MPLPPERRGHAHPRPDSTTRSSTPTVTPSSTCPLVRDILRAQAGDDAVAAHGPGDERRVGRSAACRPSRCAAPGSSARRGGVCRPATPSTAGPRSSRSSWPSGCRSSASTTRCSTRRTGWSLPRSTTPPSDARSPRAFNTFYAEAFRDHADALTPVGIIPMHTPDEAIAELEHATGELGLKAFMFGGPIARPVPGRRSAVAGRALAGLPRPRLAVRLRPGVAALRRAGRVADVPHRSHGVDDPRVGQQLRVQPHRDVRHRRRGCSRCRCSWAACPSGSPSCGSRSRRAVSRGPRRCTPTSSSHWEKRNRDAVEHYNPAHLDRGQLADLFEQYGSPRYRDRLDRLDDGLRMLSLPDEDPATLDEFAALRHPRRRRHPRRVHHRRSTSAARPTTR